MLEEELYLKLIEEDNYEELSLYLLNKNILSKDEESLLKLIKVYMKYERDYILPFKKESTTTSILEQIINKDYLKAKELLEEQLNKNNISKDTNYLYLMLEKMLNLITTKFDLTIKNLLESYKANDINNFNFYLDYTKSYIDILKTEDKSSDSLILESINRLFENNKSHLKIK
jgi:hypothetical protein